jgi:hypothetical protein
MRKIRTALLLLGISCLISLPAAGVETQKKVADSSDMAKAVEIDTQGLEPVGAEQLNDGTFEVTVESSSSMFRIDHCLLTVKDGAMEADLAMGGTGYLYLYPGTGEEAAECMNCLKRRVESIGYEIVTDRGDNVRYKRA